MAYVTREQVLAKVPAAILNDALDDDGDGLEDSGALDQVIAVASQEVDGYLGGLFTVPFETAPEKVRSAAFYFTLEAIYQRRNVPEDQNPYAKTAAWYRDHLQKVGNRELPLDAAQTKAFTPGVAITEDMRTNAQST